MIWQKNKILTFYCQNYNWEVVSFKQLQHIPQYASDSHWTPQYKTKVYPHRNRLVMKIQL